jgi:hypothetical protein
MTEEEAKTKWCPFARVLDGSAAAVAAVNRDADDSEDWPTCIGSACMAWRKYRCGQIEGERIDGYCGLAGKP